MVSSQLIVQVKYEKSSTNCQPRNPSLARPDFQLRFWETGLLQHGDSPVQTERGSLQLPAS